MGDDMITEGMLDMFIFETEQGLENHKATYPIENSTDNLC